MESGEEKKNECRYKFSQNLYDKLVTGILFEIMFQRMNYSYTRL